MILWSWSWLCNPTPMPFPGGPIKPMPFQPITNASTADFDFGDYLGGT